MRFLKLGIVSLVLVVVPGLLFVNLFPEFLWFDSFQYASIWMFRVKSEFLTWLLFTVIAYLWLATHVSFANRNSALASKSSSYDIQTPFQFLNQLISQFRRYMEQSNEEQTIAQSTYSLFLKV